MINSLLKAIDLMDEVVDRIAALEDVSGTDTKVARWLDNVGPPRPHASAA